jgi:hypothetical protein
MNDFMVTLPVPRLTMGIIPGPGLKLCIFWYSVCVCQVEALISYTPL